MHQIKLCYYWIFVWPALFCYFVTPKRHRDNLKKDMRKILGNKVDRHFLWSLYNLFVGGGSFRDIYYMRIGQLNKLFKWWLPGETLCGIYATKRDFIGGGLRIQHGWAMVLDAESVGENLWINQCVTVGYRGNGHPTIGNNVRIGTGAVVLGPIKIGDNVNIGANAIVVKDVPDNCTVVSPPAFIVKKDGIRTHEPLCIRGGVNH